MKLVVGYSRSEVKISFLVEYWKALSSVSNAVDTEKLGATSSLFAPIRRANSSFASPTLSTQRSHGFPYSSRSLLYSSSESTIALWRGEWEQAARYTFFVSISKRFKKSTPLKHHSAEPLFARDPEILATSCANSSSVSALLFSSAKRLTSPTNSLISFSLRLAAIPSSLSLYSIACLPLFLPTNTLC